MLIKKERESKRFSVLKKIYQIPVWVDLEPGIYFEWQVFLLLFFCMLKGNLNSVDSSCKLMSGLGCYEKSGCNKILVDSINLMMTFMSY